MISFDLPMFDELIDGSKQNTAWRRPEDTSTQFRLRSQMMKNWRCFLVGLLLLKIVAHYENDVNVVWVGLRGDVTPKDYEAFEFAGAAREFMNAQQPRGYKLALLISCSISRHLSKRVVTACTELVESSIVSMNL